MNNFMINLHEIRRRAGIELATPGFADRHVTDCSRWPGPGFRASEGYTLFNPLYINAFVPPV